MHFKSLSRFPSALFAALLVGLFGLTACSENGSVRITKTNFPEEIEPLQNLTFTVEGISMPDSALDRWDTTELIQFTPRIAGAFKWVKSNELLFSPRTAFKPNTDYTAQLNSSAFKGAKSAENESFRFHTAYLKPVDLEAFWGVSAQGTSCIQVRLEFNYPVDGQTIKSKLSVEGQSDIELISTEVMRTIVVALPNLTPASELPSKISVNIEKGLTMPGSVKPTEKSFGFDVPLPSKEQFTVFGIEAGLNGMGDFITVATNQQVVPTNLENYITIVPAVEYQAVASSQGIRLTGDFLPGQAYEVKIAAGLKGVLGTALSQEIVGYAAFGKAQPQIEFASARGSYLSSAGSRQLGVQISGVEKVRVTIRKVFENNLLHYLRTQRYENYEGDGGYYDYGDEQNDYGTEVYSRELSVKELAKRDGMHLLRLDPDQIVGTKGIYLVNIASTNEQYLSATKLVSLSDVGLIVRQSETEVVAWTNSILTTDKQSGVSLRLFSQNNQLLAAGTTGSDGMARLKFTRPPQPGFEPKLLIAEKEGDLNFVFYPQSAIQTSRFDVGGYTIPPGGVQAYLFGDREVYRPEEPVKMHAIVRSTNWETTTPRSLTVQVTGPGGTDFQRFKATPDLEGGVELSFTVPGYAQTGSYVLSLSDGDNVIGSRSVYVEEFMPDRLRVNTSPLPTYVPIGQTLNIGGQAINLYGTPAANRPVQVRLSLTQTNFTQKGYEDYSFGDFAGLEVGTNFLEGTTDAAGNFSIPLPVVGENSSGAPLLGKVYVTVLDETGRPVNRTLEFRTGPSVMIGYKQGAGYANLFQPMVTEFAALNNEGKPAKTSVTVEVIRVSYENAVEKDYYGSGFRYVNRRIVQTLQTRNLTLDGKGAFTYTPALAGEYQIKARISSGMTIIRTFYAYGQGSNPGFAIDPDGKIEIETDKVEYASGEEAKVILKTPFDGKLLLTIEQQGVIKHEWLNVENRSAQMTVKMEDNYAPNVYLTATLIRPHNGLKTIPLTVAHGYSNLVVTDSKHKLGVQLAKVTERVGGETTQTIEVQTSGGSGTRVVVAVVDEGILSLKNTQAPDPLAFFMQKRALQVDAYDIYPMLLPEYPTVQSSTGADKMMMAGRVNPLASKRVKPVAFWSGTLVTNGKGVAKFTYKLPAFSGAVRVMAVAYKGGRFGAASKTQKVADPVVVSAALPRFLAPGDTFNLPISLANTIQKAGRVTGKVTVTGPIKLLTSNQFTAELPSMREKMVRLRGVATGSGLGKIMIEVEGLAKTRQVIELPIRSSAGRDRKYQSARIESGQSKTFDLTGKDFVAGSQVVSVTVSRLPIARLVASFSQLIDYPYGCLEQTVSQGFAQLYYSDLLKFAKPQSRTGQNPDNNVKAAIQKAISMQRVDGGMAVWPNSYEVDPWVTAYTTHFLIEARNAGYTVPDAVLNQALTYLSQRARGREFVLVAGGKLQAQTSALYSLFVLSLEQKASLSDLNFYKSRIQSLSSTQRYLLATTYQLQGDRANYLATLPKGFTQSGKNTNLDYSSPIRDMGLVLNALLTADPNSAQATTLAQRLGASFSKSSYLNTQESAFALLSLGKLARRMGKTKANAQISLGGKAVAWSGETVTLGREAVGKTLTVKAEGGPIFVSIAQEGNAKVPPAAAKSTGLQITRGFFTPEGTPLTGKIKVGQLVVVAIDVQSTTGNSVENVVVSDLLPASLEIENPRLTEQPPIKWITNAGLLDYAEARDDRMLFYLTAQTTTKRYYYLARTVSSGSFTAGPASAEAMYDASLFARTNRQKLSVL